MQKVDISQKVTEKLKAKLHASGGKLTVGDISEISLFLVALMRETSPADDLVRTELTSVINSIQDAKRELGLIASTPAPHNMPDAKQQLDEVLLDTENAANAIMDKASTIEAAANGIEEPITRNLISDAVGEIYAACAFQDISGQRIKKVIKMMLTIDERLRQLCTAVFGQQAMEKLMDSPASEENNLMNGPQLSKVAPGQAEIDRLFSSL
jgi:chemotaxis protein CheZ